VPTPRSEDDHPAHEKARVLAALEHDREVVQRGVRIEARVALIQAEM
jgi:hypothetical protein